MLLTGSAHSSDSEGTGPPDVTTIEALSGRLIPKQVLLEYAELLMVGEPLDRDLFAEKLTRGGYTQSVLVEVPGISASRGYY